MFRKSLLLTLPVAVAMFTAIAVFVFERQRTPDWQMALDAYLARTDAVVQDVMVVQDVTGTKPWNFDASMGSPQTSAAWPWSIDTLPYPPDALHCVLIRRNRSPMGSAEEQMLFVAHHTDTLWRVSWVVHEGPMMSLHDRASTVLAEVGCR